MEKNQKMMMLLKIRRLKRKKMMKQRIIMMKQRKIKIQQRKINLKMKKIRRRRKMTTKVWQVMFKMKLKKNAKR